MSAFSQTVMSFRRVVPGEALREFVEAGPDPGCYRPQPLHVERKSLDRWQTFRIPAGLDMAQQRFSLFDSLVRFLKYLAK